MLNKLLLVIICCYLVCICPIKSNIFAPEPVIANENNGGQVLQSSTSTGYIQMSADGKKMIDSLTGKQFVPLGWKTIWPWIWDSPENPRPQLNNLTFEKWVHDTLAANGVNFINVWLNTNRQGDGNSFEHNAGEFTAAMEDPARSGKILLINTNDSSYNPVQTKALLKGDPDNINDGSNITQLFEACEKYGVKVKVSFFRQAEFREDWNVNPYNKKRITDAWWCSKSPRGCLAGPASSTAEAMSSYIQLQKNRFKFIYDMWGDSPAIAVWEFMVEINFVTDNIGSDGVRNWIHEMATYVKAIDTHNRPIMSGTPGFTWQPWGDNVPPKLPQSADESWYYEANPLFNSEDIDIVSFHNYFFFDLWDRLIATRLLQEYYPQKTLIFGGGSGPNRAIVYDDYGIGLPPSVNGPFIPDYAHQYYNGEYENVSQPQDPWINTKTHAWLNLIITGGTGGATRFISYVPAYTNDLSTIYYALSKFVKQVNWDEWNVGTMRAWEDWHDWGSWSNEHTMSLDHWVAKSPDVENADFIAGQGDGDQLMIMVRGSQNNLVLKILDLEPGNYIAKIFDWQTGDVVEQRTVSISDQLINFPLDLSDAKLVSKGECKTAPHTYKCYDDLSNPYYSRRRMAIIYLEKQLSFGSPQCLGTDNTINKDDVVFWGKDYSQNLGTIDTNSDNKMNSFDLGYLLLHWQEDCQ